MERREREERKKNVIITKVVVEGTVKQTVAKRMERMGVKGAINRIRELGRGRTERREMTIEVTMGDMEGKREVTREKTKLRGRRERIEEDLTCKERRMQWRLQEIAQRAEKNGRWVKVGYGKVEINGNTFFWDEENEILRDFRGREMEIETEEREEGKRGEPEIERGTEGEVKNA